jgi:hypothetical protein
MIGIKCLRLTLAKPRVAQLIVRHQHLGGTMHKTLLASFGLIAVTAAYSDSFTYDRDLAVAAGKAYVEAYWRVHPSLSRVALAWDRVDVVVVSTPSQAGQDGVVGVFFPETGGAGVGFACFQAFRLRVARTI